MELSSIQIVAIYLVFINVLGFALMGLDKKRARAHEWRIPEKTLFGVALVGGALGSWTGMYTFRHKTKHNYFVIGMPVIFVVELIIGIWWFITQ